MATLPLSNPEKQYGDAKTLDTFKVATKPLPVSGAPAPVRGPGRPTGTAPAATAAGGQSSLPPEHAALATKVAIAQRTYMQLAAYAQRPDAGPWTRFYAELAKSQFERAALEAREQTPFYE
jgi:hypothetical protein